MWMPEHYHASRPGEPLATMAQPDTDTANTPTLVVAAGLPTLLSVFDLSIELQAALILDARQRDVQEQDSRTLARLLDRCYTRVAPGGIHRLGVRLARLRGRWPLTLLLLADVGQVTSLVRQVRETFGMSVRVVEWQSNALERERL
jgi:hypothetical protein